MFYQLFLLVLLLVSKAASEAPAEEPKPLSESDLDTISIYIRRTLENLRDVMPSGIPELNIPPLEPFKMPAVDIPQIRHGAANVDLSLRDLVVGGLSSFVVRSAKGNPSSMGVELELFFPEVAARANYALNGKILILPLYGTGPAVIQVNDLKIRVAASVGIEGMKKVQLNDLNVDLTFGQVQVYLEGILGGGSLGDIVNSLLNAMGKIIYDKLKDRILPEVTRILRGCLNKELSKVDLQTIIGGMLPFSAHHIVNTANTYIDQVMENLRPQIRKSRLDPAGIPDQGAEFSQSRRIRVGWFYREEVYRGSARMFNGQAHGLSTIHRTESCSFYSEGTVMNVGCILGVNHLRGNFGTRAEFMGTTVNPHITIHVERVRVKILVGSNLLLPGSKPNLHQFSISELSHIHVGIHGLGPLGWIFNPVANVVTNAFRHHIVAAIEHPVRAELIKALGKVPLPNFN